MSIYASVLIELTTADSLGALAAIQAAGIEMRQIEQISELTLRFSVSRKDSYGVQSVAQKRGEQLKILSQKGVYGYIRNLVRRPVLLLGLSLLLYLSIWAPGKIFFIKVEGNQVIPSKAILENASRCVIQFGTTAREVRSERMKNKLLSSMEQLQWAGINTYGCVAVISVKERAVEENVEDECGVSSIIAVCDGVIDSVTVLKGSAACTAGQAVKAGQILISGYTDCGIKILAEQAEGEVFAYTKRKLEVVMPLKCQIRGKQTVSETKYSLIIGKKRINLYNNSGILDGSCVKMYSWHYITLPGDFALPLAILAESRISYDIDGGNVDISQLQLQNSAAAYLSAIMNGGRILSANEQLLTNADTKLLRGDYSCYEMIGITRFEGILEKYGKINGTNSQRRAG